MKQSQLPPALRKPVTTPTPTAPATIAEPSAVPSTVSAPSAPPTAPPKTLDGWEPIPTPKELGMKPLSPLPAALRPQTGSLTPPTLGRPANIPKPQPSPGLNLIPPAAGVPLVSTPKTKFTGGTITTTPIPTVAKPPYNPRIPVLDRISIFEGTFIGEDGKPFCVETRLTGNGGLDKATLVVLARKLKPRSNLKLASTRIFTRDPQVSASYPAGITMGQLFGESGSDTETGLEIGTVFFQSERCQVVLRNLRARNCVTVALRPPGGNQIVFSNQIGAGRLAKELGYVVKEILGNEARELEITIKILP